jgi:hypothetical protein
MSGAIKRYRWGVLVSLLVAALVGVDVWFLLRSPVHPEFGKIYSANMSESHKRNMTVWDKRIVSVKRWLSLPMSKRQLEGGSDCGLQIGPATLGWSVRENWPPRRTGYIYLGNVESTEDFPPLWEIALSKTARLAEVSRDDLRCEFYGKNDPRGTSIFGTAWNGPTIVMPEGQVFFARLATNRSTVYVIRLAKQVVS